jgi:hypothetical protein
MELLGLLCARSTFLVRLNGAARSPLLWWYANPPCVLGTSLVGNTQVQLGRVPTPGVNRVRIDQPLE